MFKRESLDLLLSLYLKDNHDEEGNLIYDFCLDFVWCRMMGGCGVYETCGNPIHCNGLTKKNFDWEQGRNKPCVNLMEAFDEYWHPDIQGSPDLMSTYPGSKSSATHERKFGCIDEES